MKSQIMKATQALQANIPAAQSSPFRPKYHFAPPANWMNDPNGTIYHDEVYHLFYQHNPYKPRWGRIHWGHAKSVDLVHWEHLPIALAPDPGLKELHCFSGCCVIADDGTPTIFYTNVSAKSLASKVQRFAEQWVATGDPGMLTWKKNPRNPVLSEDIHHNGDGLRNWRDPYIWKERDKWYLAIAGQFKGENCGSVLLYQSADLETWEYTGRLFQGDERLGKTWECPNYFRLGGKYVLVVSPYGQVIYNIGDFRHNKHNGGRWYIFDHGKDFYATNTYFDDKGRVIVVGWVKVDGKGTWAGCMSIPRQLKVDSNDQLEIEPISELERLRYRHMNVQQVLEDGDKNVEMAAYYGGCVEILARYDLTTAESVGFKLVDDHGEHLIKYDCPSHTLLAVEKHAKMQFPNDTGQLDLHIFIDKSVIEIFINGRETFTTVFYPQLEPTNELKIIPVFFKTQGKVEIDFWTLEGIGI